MACGYIAFKELGISIGKYYAYEIDKYAIKNSSYNFPDIQHKGNVFNADFSQYKNIDWLIGGSPCTYWSIAQKSSTRETEASGIGWELFSQYVRALKQASPKYFIYERVGSYPRPNGELSTSQAFRIYGVNSKSTTLSANGGGAGAKTGLYAILVEYKGEEPTKVISNTTGQTYTVYKVINGEITIKDRKYPIKLKDGYYIIRKLTVNECKRLQTVPDWYEFPVSDTQAYKMLGNGWTVDVIKHLIKTVQKEV